MLVVASLYCPSCGTTYDAVAADADDLSAALQCENCHSFLSDLYVGDRFATPAADPEPGEPSLICTFTPLAG